MWNGLSLEGEIFPTLSRNEKVEQHIRKKTHKRNTLRFWIEGGVIPLCGFGSVLILVRSPRFCPLGLPIKWLQSRRFVVMTGSYECNLIPVSKVFLTEVLGKHVLFKCPFKCVNGSTSEDRLWLRYSYLKMLPLEWECTNVEGTLTWGGDLLGIQVWV